MLVIKPADTRNKNATTLLRLLLKQDNISRVALSRTTGLTKTTISSIINEFIALGIVEESSTISTGNVGKSPIPLRIRADAVYTIGAHLERQKVKTVLIDARMNIITRKKGLSYEGLGPKGVLESLFLSIDDSMKYAEEHNIKVGTIGIGVPGPLDAQTGVVRHPPKFKGWKDVPLGKIVHERYKLPVWIENDANVGVLAEKWHGGGKDLKNFVYILANEGIGAGIIIDDELYQGAYDYVGEIGHMLFYNYDHGKFRYFEDISGVDILIKMARSQGLNIKNVKDISDLLQTNDKVACSIVRDIATWIGAAIIDVIHIIGPQTVFIGGKMAVLGDVLIQPIKEIVSQYLFGDQKVEVRLSEISEDAVALGAAIYTTTKWLEMKSTKRVPY
ncbi:MAG TPA: ROK family transcriptional regulator [candidate division WOR-3 bacterium]|uniref:ROK family transcriptional regulator n=1 Tax=candidate division WOR-3 bacterium TaxID=2052148 RepID=A0A7C5HN04_UNCW3|nr:ROK family transcriptional regulator [candidate division WOR-3 bacterium]